MKIKPIIHNYYTDERPLLFGITTKPPVKRYYAPDCWNEISKGDFKDKSFTLYKNFIDNKHCSTLIALYKCGKWVKSKLKYFDNENKMKTLWSYASEKNQRYTTI